MYYLQVAGDFRFNMTYPTANERLRTSFVVIMLPGESLPLIHPYTAEGGVSYWSSDTATATVTSTHITAVAPGRVQVVGEKHGLRAVLYVHVVPSVGWFLYATSNDGDHWPTGLPWSFPGFRTAKPFGYDDTEQNATAQGNLDFLRTLIPAGSIHGLEFDVTRLETDAVNNLWTFTIVNNGAGYTPSTWADIGLNASNIASRVILVYTTENGDQTAANQYTPPYGAVTLTNGTTMQFTDVDLTIPNADGFSPSVYGIQLLIPEWDVVNLWTWTD